jgi:hypothetical protein
MAILVDDSAETVLPIYAEVFDLIGFERLEPDAQGHCASERPVGAVLVVVRLVLSQGTPQAGLNPDQRAVQQFAAKGLDQSSMIEFIWGIRTSVSTVAIPAEPRTLSINAGYLASR